MTLVIRNLTVLYVIYYEFIPKKTITKKLLRITRIEHRLSCSWIFVIPNPLSFLSYIYLIPYLQFPFLRHFIVGKTELWRDFDQRQAVLTGARGPWPRAHITIGPPPNCGKREKKEKMDFKFSIFFKFHIFLINFYWWNFSGWNCSDSNHLFFSVKFYFDHF